MRKACQMLLFVTLCLLFSAPNVNAKSRAAGNATAGDDVQSDHEWSKSWTVPSAAELHLVADRGDVHVTQVPGDSIHASVTTSYWHISESEVEISSTQDSKGVEIRIRVPEEHFHFFHRNSGSLKIDLQVPTGSRLDLHSGFGKIRVAEFDGRVDADTGFGDVDATGRFESLSLRTGFGTIHVEASAGSHITHDWRLSSGFGDITLRLPADLNADLEARTGFGHVSCDFPITITDTRSHSSINAHIGSGGPPVNIDTGFGSVHIRKL
ncbi:MAG TPA: DUF4097 family beta strand repeat-containing protein [Candidatus Acidoferrales bacterium]|nr:DUF4097 family beta strand repeat-containing protein [Candidatus Acidoferrales bacterium]